MGSEDNKEVKTAEQQKRGRGRPRKPDSEKKIKVKSNLPRGRPRIYPPKDPNAPKRPRGRPRIHPPKVKMAVKSGLPRGRPSLSPNKMKILKVKVRSGISSKKSLMDTLKKKRGRGRPRLTQIQDIVKKNKGRGRPLKDKTPVGRPRIHPPKEETDDPDTPKRSRGRPRKSVETNGLSSESENDQEQINAYIKTEEESINKKSENQVETDTPNKSRGRPRKSVVQNEVMEVEETTKGTSDIQDGDKRKTGTGKGRGRGTPRKPR